MNKLISVTTLNKDSIYKLVQSTYKMMHFNEMPLKNKTLINYFCEPSTRTSASFHRAMFKLGGNVIPIYGETSSNKKGESIEDSIKTLNYYGDIIVLRHPDIEAIYKASNVSTIPLINAGNGNGEHPTQALLDLFTIYDELMKRTQVDIFNKGIVVTFTGDIYNSRTIHSLINLLCLLHTNITFIYCGEIGLGIPIDLYNYVHHNFPIVRQITWYSVQEAMNLSDVLYMTRIQKERIHNNNSYNIFSLNKNTISHLNKYTIIMHPLPRQEELSTEIDEDNRAVYFKQVENGVYMRMALLLEMLHLSKQEPLLYVKEL
jgi:aspartate carbamoyltransferase